MYCGSASPFQEIIYARNYQQFVTMFLKMQQALVGVNHLLKVYLLLNNMYKRVSLIILTVYLVEFIDINGVLDDYGSEYAACKVTAIRDEVDIGVKAALQVLD